MRGYTIEKRKDILSHCNDHIHLNPLKDVNLIPRFQVLHYCSVCATLGCRKGLKVS